MKENFTKEEDFFDAIKHGHVWHKQKIKEKLIEIIEIKFNNSNYDLRYDFKDKYHWIYDNECYLFVFDGKIELRSDRDNVFSSDKTFIYEISDLSDIKIACDKFRSMTMEGEDDDEI